MGVENQSVLSKRELLAGMALQGLLAKIALFKAEGEMCRADPASLAIAAIEFADALLAWFEVLDQNKEPGRILSVHVLRIAPKDEPRP